MEPKVYEVPSDWTRRAYVDASKYKAMYEASIRDPDAFWGEHGKRIHWYKPYTKVKNTNFGPGAYPSSPSSTFNQITAVGEPRSVQLGLRLTF